MSTASNLDTEEGHQEFNKSLFDSISAKQANPQAQTLASVQSTAAIAISATGSQQGINGGNQAGQQNQASGAQTIGAGVLRYKSLIWSTADTLLGCGVRPSEFPRFMAPFFALALVESRIRRLRNEKLVEFQQETGSPFDSTNKVHIQWLETNIFDEGYGYHPDIAKLGIGLSALVKVKAGNFLVQLDGYLKLFDPETRRLLGVDYAPGQPKFLDIKGITQDLASRANDPLYTFCAGAGGTPGWAHVDLVDFDNSEVTTLEEHIKRMWADISAETAGEQYTPKDLIELACMLGIEARRANTNDSQICDIYDMACGGGNFLFAAESALRSEFPGLSVRVRGQELNDALYALAALEARFRPDAKIEWGNTLTHDHFLGSKFGMIVANPPYGVDWKAFASTVKTSNCGRFDAGRMPPTSDGQLLFLQHAVFHLEENGVAAVVHSGSTLFSGDAGGGESETRRWLLQDLDVVEAIVQLPKNEFFNTGIATYLWILNKNKPEGRKGKVLMINAESCFKKLKKNLNMKNCEIDEASRERLIDCFKVFANSDISKVLDVDDILYNKVSLELHRHDEQGRAVKKSFEIDPSLIAAVTLDGNASPIPTAELSLNQDQSAESTKASAKDTADEFNAKVKSANLVSVLLSDGTKWSMDRDEHRITETATDGKLTEHGFGVLALKGKVGKSKGHEFIKMELSIDPLIESDTETISYSSKKDEAGKPMNEIVIDDFIKKWVRDPSKIKPSKAGKISEVGAEINFNRIFPKKVEVRLPQTISDELRNLDEELKASEAKLASLLKEV